MTAFADKYKPTSLNEFVFPDEYSKSLIQLWLATSGAEPLLLFGGVGTGKTSLADLLFNELYPEAKNSGAITRVDPKFTQGNKRLKSHLTTVASQEWSSIFGAKTYIIIDELHSVPDSEQDSLRGYLEKYLGRAHHVFTTNYLDQVDEGIRSRCDKVEIGPPVVESWISRAKMILENEQVDPPSDSELGELIELAYGDCREILRLLQGYVNSVKSLDGIQPKELV